MWLLPNSFNISHDISNQLPIQINYKYLLWLRTNQGAEL